jgi:hypothetical protein
MSKQLLFQVTNHHVESCGTPPQIDEQTFPNVYRSYFENQYGEQTIFLYDYEQEHGTLYMGDAGWEHSFLSCSAIAASRFVRKNDFT